MATNSYGSQALNDGTNYIVHKGDWSDPPLVLLGGEYARRHGGKVNATRFGTRTYTWEGSVKSTSHADLQDKWDALVLALSKKGQYLTIQEDTDTRRYLCDAVVVSAPFGVGNLLWVPYTATATISQPFAEAASASTDTQAALVLSLVSGSEYKAAVNITEGGNAPTPPTFTITVPVTGPYGITQLWMLNTSLSPNRYIRLVQTLAALDVIVFNADTYAITVNGATAAVTEGAFFDLDPAAAATNALEVHALASSAPTLSVVTTWRSRYLS